MWIAHLFALALLIERLLSPSVAIADDIGADVDLDAAYEQEFDPWEGIERDGRVPKVELPADLPNPERWRYIPPGRIKPGNFFQHFLVSRFISPVVFRQEDVGWGFGLAAAADRHPPQVWRWDVAVSELESRIRHASDFAIAFPIGPARRSATPQEMP